MYCQHTYVSNTTPSAGTFNGSTGAWTIGTLTNGSSATLTITATVNASGSYANTATISAAEADPTPGNNGATVTPYPFHKPMLITKTVNNATPNVGGNVIFTLTASNAGPSTATLSVSDVLPARLYYVSDASAGTFNGSTGAWTLVR
jgi:uncharacterized repeat protein (TIGR01451 family)